jgi:dTDP-4-dehydrorhamnose 3,5-epimerase
MGSSLNDPFFTKLEIKFHPKGDIHQALKKSESSFCEFGEAYFTSIKHSEIKGWKMHKQMHMNLISIVGAVRFYVRSGNTQNLYRFELGENNYGRLTIPCGNWVAFEGLASSLNLILNIASIEHDPNEAVSLPLSAMSLK